ncbi:hypothetical protein J7L48_05335 [bacterium]|nr:hypothetical protein [bacterium]
MEEEVKKETLVEEKGKKKKIGLNWNSILVFFLLGFIITLPGILVKLIPATSGKVVKFGHEIYALKDNGIVYHYNIKNEKIKLIEKVGNDDGTLYPDAQMLFGVGKIIVNKGNVLDIITYNIKTKKYEFSETIKME